MAFIELAASRTAGFGGAEPLRFTEILAFMQIHGIDGLTERRHFVRRMRLIDRIYLKLSQKKAAAGGKHGK